ncbi:MAG TPA: serine/threonine-protein kinase [Pyrinomonadaceae bacterium]|nr:serine/threonine-protein kinase [Pyrinomonadaceae bacterium]
MERPLWDRIQEIYYLALPVARSQRSAYLAGACNNDPLLAREVASLLHADDIADQFLEVPVFELGLKVISNSNRDKSSSAEPGDSLVGTVIDGRYLVENKLGHGGIGKVYLARDLTLHHRKVVIKVLLEASLAEPYVVTKFRQEIEALSRIDHPNVVSVLGAGELADGKPYIVMQYVEGVTLRSQIRSEGMDLERAALILKQMGAALDDVHERRIFHRDLKPENVLLQFLKGGKEWVKIVDFGIAKVKDSVVAPSTANKMPVGTVLYMSPEQLRGGEQITAASDTYSMAIIAFEMITGRRPFNPSSAPQLLEMQRAGVRLDPIDLRPNLSTEVRAILLRALSFDPAARYQNAAEFGDHLARALTEDQEPLHQVAAERIRSTDGRTLKYIAGALLLVVIGITVAIYLRPNTVIAPENQVGATSQPQPTPPARSFTYWLDVQRMRSGKPYQPAFLSTGNETFETGYKFRLNISSVDPGFLYLFNEGPPSRSGTSFTIIYPLPSTNQGSATLGANQLVQSGWNTFTGESGTENFWIVWSTSPVPELEAAKTEAFKHPQGGLTGDTLAATKKFLMAKKEEVKTKYTTNKETHQITVRGNGDLLVRMVEFQHR